MTVHLFPPPPPRLPARAHRRVMELPVIQEGVSTPRRKSSGSRRAPAAGSGKHHSSGTWSAGDWSPHWFIRELLKVIHINSSRQQEQRKRADLCLHLTMFREECDSYDTLGALWVCVQKVLQYG